MDIGKAVTVLLGGGKVARSTWGKARFLCYMPEISPATADDVCPAMVSNVISNQNVKILPRIDLFAGEYIVPGWTPSIIELLADDWIVIS